MLKRKKLRQSAEKEKQQVWPSVDEMTKNHAKNFKYLNDHKKKRELVNNTQIA